MHPTIGLGANPNCNLSTLEQCEPTYEQLQAAGKLWPCPDGAKDSGAACGSNTCVESKINGSGNPLCSGQLNDEHPCWYAGYTITSFPDACKPLLLKTSLPYVCVSQLSDGWLLHRASL